MSALSLFDEIYKQAYQRGHVVFCAAIGLRQLGFHVGPEPRQAHASFRMAEDIVEAAEEFYEAVKPGFRKGFTVPETGDKVIFIDTSCKKCGHPYCDLYLTAGLLPQREPMGTPVFLVQKGTYQEK